MIFELRTLDRNVYSDSPSTRDGDDKYADEASYSVVSPSTNLH
jgi:hypothetical protein